MTQSPPTRFTPGDQIHAVRGQNLFLPGHTQPVAGTIQITDGKISAHLPHTAAIHGAVLDVGSWVVMPGLVDTHAHINEPGRTEWEGFESATHAAAAGGITTIVDMPLNSLPPTTTLENLKIKQNSALNHCEIDYGFWGGVIPGNSSQLLPMIQAGVRGFKAFLIDSGVPEFPSSNESTLREAMILLAAHGGTLLAHAELNSHLPSDLPSDLSTPHNPRTYRDYLASRPASWEVQAIELLIRLCRETHCPVHIVHLSAADALPSLRKAQREGLPITAETCPHYLTLSAESIPDGATQYKCAPPIRGTKNQDLLWEALLDGTLCCIVSDHSPCTPQLKSLEQGSFDQAWGGISSLQLGLSLIWTEMNRRKIPLYKIAQWMSQAPARLAKLYPHKGSLEIGSDADFVIWDPSAYFTVTPESLFHRHKLTPYLGRTLHGVVHSTLVRGRLVCQQGPTTKNDPDSQTEFPANPSGRNFQEIPYL